MISFRRPCSLLAHTAPPDLLNHNINRAPLLSRRPLSVASVLLGASIFFSPIVVCRLLRRRPRDSPSRNDRVCGPVRRVRTYMAVPGVRTAPD